MLPAAKEAGLKPVTADLDISLPFASESFDSVAVISVIQYIKDTSSFIRETARILKPGGELILYGQNLTSWLRSALSFLNDPDSEEFRQDHGTLVYQMETCGLSYVKTYLLRYPWPGIGEVVHPSSIQLGLSTSFLVAAKKTG